MCTEDATVTLLTQLFIRGQKSKGSSNTKFGGPNRYVAVVVRPFDLPPLKQHTPLNVGNLEKKGYVIKYFGEGYNVNRGPKSMLGQAIERAKEFMKNPSLKDS